MNGEIQEGFYTLTYRFRLLDGDERAFAETKALYNRIVAFYLELYFSRPFLREIPKGRLLREMEKLTIPGRGCDSAEVEFPFARIPVYFRRAAVNGAITAAKQLESRKQRWNGGMPDQAPLLYKGMYRNLSPKGIEMKLWSGETWGWHSLKLQGRPWPEEGKQMSPALVLDVMNRHPMLHVPVQLRTPDTRTIRQKMESGGDVCGVCFSNEDAFAVCGIVRRDGSYGKSVFCKGGKQYQYLCRQTLKKISRSKKAVGCYGRSKDPVLNKKYWNYLKHLGDFYAQQTAHEIVEFCKANGIGVLVLPDYEERYGSYVLNRVGKWTPLYLSVRIRKILEYKAWGGGISMAKVRYFRSYDEKAGGNKYLGTARRIGEQCLKNHGVLTAETSVTGNFMAKDGGSQEKDAKMREEKP